MRAAWRLICRSAMRVRAAAAALARSAYAAVGAPAGGGPFAGCAAAVLLLALKRPESGAQRTVPDGAVDGRPGAPTRCGAALTAGAASVAVSGPTDRTWLRTERGFSSLSRGNRWRGRLRSSAW